MLRALGEFEIGGIRTLVGFHRALLSHPCFVAAETWHGLVESQELAEQAEQFSHPTTTLPAASDGRVDRTGDDGRGRRPPRRDQGAAAGAGVPRARARAASAGRRSADGEAEAVVSPMQGTVLDVRVAEGDEVEAGDVICIVEAMKMENEIAAHRPGACRGARGRAGRPGDERADDLRRRRRPADPACPAGAAGDRAARAGRPRREIRPRPEARPADLDRTPAAAPTTGAARPGARTARPRRFTRVRAAWISTSTRARSCFAASASRCPTAGSRRRRRRPAPRPRSSAAPVVVKAQVLTGGRGKAGGIKLAAEPDEAEQRAARDPRARHPRPRRRSGSGSSAPRRSRRSTTSRSRSTGARSGRC